MENIRLTKSQKTVLDILRKNSKQGLTPNEIMSNASFAPRTVRYALRKLLKLELARRIPNLLDMRQHLYTPS